MKIIMMNHVCIYIYLYIIPWFNQNILQVLIGDINLFYNDDENDKNCEINLMIGIYTQKIVLIIRLTNS